jgi:hypothetical protein
MCKQTNDHKHSGLTKHEPSAAADPGLSLDGLIYVPESAEVTLKDMVLNGVHVGRGQAVKVSRNVSAEQASSMMPGLPIRRMAGNKYECKLAGTKWDVLELLTIARKEIATLSSSVLKELGV